ncbi:putative ATP-grasp-modified RiPP [Actinopolymorpha alba]|uniref:putative ATP-grasp-modified RiPP n=1 Tax=Actinopolymorpha alba TaxID=533267 RepID=UPI00038005C0|nr:putative ATP-grasp-modified RiPP [Actinopolymorpha alba]
MDAKVNAIRPWGLSRMAPYRTILQLPEATLLLDPLTQTTQRLGADGQPISFPGHGSNTGTEQRTQVQTHDGQGPSSVDTDHSQDNDRD